MYDVCVDICTHMWGAPAPPWATAVAAVGPGEGEAGDRLGWGHIQTLHKAPKDYTKPQNIVQSPDRQYKDLTY